MIKEITTTNELKIFGFLIHIYGQVHDFNNLHPKLLNKLFVFFNKINYCSRDILLCREVE